MVLVSEEEVVLRGVEDAKELVVETEDAVEGEGEDPSIACALCAAMCSAGA